MRQLRGERRQPWKRAGRRTFGAVSRLSRSKYRAGQECFTLAVTLPLGVYADVYTHTSAEAERQAALALQEESFGTVRAAARDAHIKQPLAS